MDLLKRHRAEDQDRTRPAGRPAMGPDSPAPAADADAAATAPGAAAHGAPPPDPEHRYVGGAARTGPDAPLAAPADPDGPLHRTTARTPVTTVREAPDPATDPYGRAAGSPPGKRRWFGLGAPAPGGDRGDPDERRHAGPDSDGDGVADRRPRREREVVDEVVIHRWSLADALVTLVGALVAAAGVIGLVRAEVDGTWYEPVVQVAGADHTPLLGAVEVGAGALIALAGIARRRIIATALGVAMAVAGAVAALETAEVARELAVEDWWGWTLCGAGVFVALMGLVPRKGRIERVTRRDAAGDDRAAASARPSRTRVA